MARAGAAPFLCGLLVLQALLLQGAADVAPGVEIAWAPHQTCDDSDSPTRNCLVCNQSASKCEVCLPGFGFNKEKNCARCANPLCAVCQLNGNAMTKCTLCKGVPDSNPMSIGNPGFPTYMNTKGVCLQCTSQALNTGCLSCDAKGKTCTSCNDGYFMRDGQCIKCNGGPMCAKCDSTGTCTACKQTTTAPSFGLNASKQCVRCSARECLNCAADSSKCTQCADGAAGIGQRGYGVNALGGCSLCRDPLCAQCGSNRQKCTGCVSDDWRKFYPYLDKQGVCRKGARKGCLYYNQDGSCKECDAGYILAGKGCDKLPTCRDPQCYDCRGDTNSCRQCNRKWYFDTRTRSCQQCRPDKCDACSSKDVCTKCARGYGLVGGICKACAVQNPADPDNVPWCDRCDGNVKVCTKCFPEADYKPDASGRCVKR